MPIRCGFISWAFCGVERGLARAAIKTLKLEKSKIFWARDWATRRSKPSQRPGKSKTLFSPSEFEKCFFKATINRLGVSELSSFDNNSYFSCM